MIEQGNCFSNNFGRAPPALVGGVLLDDGVLDEFRAFAVFEELHGEVAISLLKSKRHDRGKDHGDSSRETERHLLEKTLFLRLWVGR